MIICGRSVQLRLRRGESPAAPFPRPSCSSRQELDLYNNDIGGYGAKLIAEKLRRTLVVLAGTSKTQVFGVFGCLNVIDT